MKQDYPLSFLIFIFILPLVSCTKNGSTPSLETGLPSSMATVAWIETPTYEERPEFIAAVSPPESVIIPFELYHHFSEASIGHGIVDIEDGFHSSICVRPSLRFLVQPGDILLDEHLIWERMDLLVNGAPMEAYNKVFQRGLPMGSTSDGPARSDTAWIEGDTYCWKAPLEKGRWQATFQFRQTSGDVKTYTWNFEIRE